MRGKLKVRSKKLEGRRGNRQPATGNRDHNDRLATQWVFTVGQLPVAGCRPSRPYVPGSEAVLQQRIGRTVPAVILLTFNFLLLTSLLSAAGEPDAFALPGIGARAAGMGGAYTGFADDADALYFNAAGLAWMEKRNVTAMVQAPVMQTYRHFVGLGLPWQDQGLTGGAALGWLRLGSSGIELTSADERVIGDADLFNDLVMAGAGLRLLKNVSLGAMIKYMRFGFDEFAEGGFGFDLGVLARYDLFRLGLNWTDVSGTVLKGDSIQSGEKVTDKIPSRFRFGGALTLREPRQWPISINVLGDALVKLEGDQDVRFFSGLEAWLLHDQAAVRTGYQEGNGPTFGLSGRWRGLQIDYSYLLSLEISDEHRVSTTLRF